MVRRIAAFLLAAAVAGACAGEASRFRVSSAMVLVNASVVDSHGRPISGLPRESFRLFENHAEKKIAWFSEDQTPVSMVIVFDISGSMSGKLSRCAEAVADLLRSSQAGDEFALVAFSNQPQLVQPWTADEAAIPAALLNARAHGNTAAIDALHTAGAYARTGANARKLLFVLSDGGDNSSRWRETQVLHELQEMDLEVYAVDIRDAEFTPHYPELFDGPGLLSRLCGGLAGRYVAVERMGELEGAVERIRSEIRSQYILGYRPTEAARDGRFHPVEVKVMPPAGMRRVSVRWRRGWREPQGDAE